MLEAALKNALLAFGLEGKRCAVALSGGADSTCLAALLAALQPLAPAFIVDHGLRAEAAAEAAEVAARAAALGLVPHILQWQGVKPKTGLMEAARAARYALLLEACYAHKVDVLLIAHHADDQLETVLMRQAQQSGVQGLAGMPCLSWRGDIALLRPLLPYKKQDLIDFCHAHSLPFVTDPSNSNTTYTRARVRAAQAAGCAPLPPAWQAYQQTRQQQLDVLATLPQQWQAGGLFWPDFAEVTPPDIALIRLRYGLQAVGQGRYPPAWEAVEAAWQRLQQGQPALTLAGCRVQWLKKTLVITREAAAIAPLTYSHGQHQLWWDKRWRLSFNTEDTLTLAPLGRGAFRLVPQAAWVKAVPAACRPALPALWQGQQLVAVLQGHWCPYFRPLDERFIT